MTNELKYQTAAGEPVFGPFSMNVPEGWDGETQYGFIWNGTGWEHFTWFTDGSAHGNGKPYESDLVLIQPKKPQVEPWDETELIIGGVILDDDQQRIVIDSSPRDISLYSAALRGAIHITYEYAAAHCQFRFPHETEWRPAGKVVSE